MNLTSQQGSRVLPLHNPFIAGVTEDQDYSRFIRLYAGTDYGQGFAVGLTLSASHTVEAMGWLAERDAVALRDALNAMLVTLEIERENAIKAEAAITDRPHALDGAPTAGELRDRHRFGD